MLEKIEITFINQYAGGMSDGLCHQFRWRVSSNIFGVMQTEKYPIVEYLENL
jgi:hypothetical protein